MNKFMTFGEALELLKEGKLVAREGWNGKGMFIFMRPGDKLDINTIVHKVKSLPDHVKGFFANLTNPQGRGVSDDMEIEFTPYLCMKAADGSIVNGWLASQTDMLAEDWTQVFPYSS